MTGFKLLLANANGALDTHLTAINNAFNRAVKQVSEDLSLDSVDVVCLNDPPMVIPEIGIGGYTPHRHLVYLYLDGSKDLSEDEMFYTLCHEFHHARRYDGPGYGTTLFDSMVFEGLATAFEAEVSNDMAFMPTTLHSRTGTDALIKKYREAFGDKNFDHFTWFIYDQSKKLPRWAGYELGYFIVSQYLSRTNKKASELVLEGPATFLKFLTVP